MNISSGTIASTISNICINEATANNTHVINGGGITGGPVTVVDHQGVLEDYAYSWNGGSRHPMPDFPPRR